jgi:hypothetical protein
LALVEAEVARRFGSELRKKFLSMPLLETATVMPVGVMDLVGGVVMDFFSYLPRFAPEGYLRSLGSGDGGAIICTFLLLGGIASEPILS